MAPATKFYGALRCVSDIPQHTVTKSLFNFAPNIAAAMCVREARTPEHDWVTVDLLSLYPLLNIPRPCPNFLPNDTSTQARHKGALRRDDMAYGRRRAVPQMWNRTHRSSSGRNREGAALESEVDLSWKYLHQWPYCARNLTRKKTIVVQRDFHQEHVALIESH